MATGARVVLGTAERLDDKFAKLKAIAVQRPRLWSEIKELNLIVPSRAGIVERAESSLP